MDTQPAERGAAAAWQGEALTSCVWSPASPSLSPSPSPCPKSSTSSFPSCLFLFLSPSKGGPAFGVFESFAFSGPGCPTLFGFCHEASMFLCCKKRFRSSQVAGVHRFHLERHYAPGEGIGHFADPCCRRSEHRTRRYISRRSLGRLANLSFPNSWKNKVNLTSPSSRELELPQLSPASLSDSTDLAWASNSSITAPGFFSALRRIGGTSSFSSDVELLDLVDRLEPLDSSPLLLFFFFFFPFFFPFFFFFRPISLDPDRLSFRLRATIRSSKESFAGAASRPTPPGLGVAFHLHHLLLHRSRSAGHAVRQGRRFPLQLGALPSLSKAPCSEYRPWPGLLVPQASPVLQLLQPPQKSPGSAPSSPIRGRELPSPALPLLLVTRTLLLLSRGLALLRRSGSVLEGRIELFPLVRGVDLVLAIVARSGTSRSG